MSNKPDLELLFDLLKEMREDQKLHGRELVKQSTVLESLDCDIKELKPVVAKNTQDIAEHMRRTDLLERLHLDNQKRIEISESRLNKLEEPVKAKEWFKKNIIALLSTVATIITILAFLLSK